METAYTELVGVVQILTRQASLQDTNAIRNAFEESELSRSLDFNLFINEAMDDNANVEIKDKIGRVICRVLTARYIVTVYCSTYYDFKPDYRTMWSEFIRHLKDGRILESAVRVLSCDIKTRKSVF